MQSNIVKPNEDHFKVLKLIEGLKWCDSSYDKNHVVSSNYSRTLSIIVVFCLNGVV